MGSYWDILGYYLDIIGLCLVILSCIEITDGFRWIKESKHRKDGLCIFFGPSIGCFGLTGPGEPGAWQQRPRPRGWSRGQWSRTVPELHHGHAVLGERSPETRLGCETGRGFCMFLVLSFGFLAFFLATLEG